MVPGTALGYDLADATPPDAKRIGLMESVGERLPPNSAREPGLISETARRLNGQSQDGSPCFAAAVVAPMWPTRFLQAEYFSGG
jgi:hypothetical protein